MNKMSLAKDFLESLKQFEESEEKQKCPECGSEDVDVKDNECKCNACGNEWKEDEDGKEEEKDEK